MNYFIKNTPCNAPIEIFLLPAGIKNKAILLSLFCIFCSHSYAEENTLPQLDDFSLEIEAELNTEYEGNLDLNSDEDADIGVTEAEVAFTFFYEPSEYISTELAFVVGRDIFFVDEADEEDSDFKLELDKALLTLSDLLSPGLTIEVGRSKIRDEPRRFILDENLDGVRAIYEAQPFTFDASVSREKIVDIDLLDEEENPQVTYYSAFLDYEFAENATVGPYFFFRDGDEEDEGQLAYMGIRSAGLIDRWRYWFDASHVRGDDGETDVSGYAVDTALSYAFDAPYQPSLSVGYAFGSGDSDPDDNVDHSYRQTGLQENEAKFHGIPRFKYFGEVLNPELSNLHIFTVGAGARSDDISLDLVFHHYRLVEFTDELGDTRLDADLLGPGDGGKKSLGNEIDVIVGVREIAGVPDFGLDIAGGYFWPGEAFSPETNDDAFFFRIEFAYAF